jgi:HSP20 family protein
MPKDQQKDTPETERKTDGEPRSITRRDSALRPAAMPVASPFTLMRRFVDDLDRLFGFSFGPFMPAGDVAPSGEEGRQTMWVPALEVVERDGQLVIRGDFPGLTKDQIDVEVTDGQLTISGERRREHEQRRGGFYRSERSYGTFFRAVPMPDGVDPDQVKATFSNGVLEITMPLPKRPQAQHIEVQETRETKQPSQPEAKSA